MPEVSYLCIACMYVHVIIDMTLEATIASPRNVRESNREKCTLDRCSLPIRHVSESFFVKVQFLPA